MPFSTTEQNRIADEIVANALTLYANTGDPGTAGTSNRITGAPTVTLAAANWSTASNGDVTYNADAAHGVIDAANSQTITHYSIFRGNAFVASEALSANVTVTAGGTYTVNTGTIMFNLTSS